MKDKRIRFEYRRKRVRKKIVSQANGLPRLSVRRSLKYLYAQVIDDAKGKTLVAATSLKKGSTKAAKNIEDAKALGKIIAEKALGAGIKQVVFDRCGYQYHGRIKAVADAARSAGLKI
ncbi:MAG: 50S ribosomal protein L18 [Elusimicrobiota bacterium]